nr:GDSL-type esterase/lipase family protein [uncultured Draconibacterium sp.]
MNRLKFIVVITLLAVVAGACKQQVKVACVGDSITEGVGTEKWNKSSYPVVLNELLGEEYMVMNCGRSAATMLKKSDLTYWMCNELDNVFAFQPDIITIKLGTNDSKDYNWDAANYEKDYQALIDTFKTIPTNPEIYVCLPAPAFQRRWSINDTTIREQVIPIIEKLADKNQLTVIDAYSKLQDQEANFPDGIHPNEEGAGRLAEVIAEAIK